MEQKKNVEEMSITELEATLFRIDQSIKVSQYNYQQVAKIYENKVKAKKQPPIKVDKPKEEKKDANNT